MLTVSLATAGRAALAAAVAALVVGCGSSGPPRPASTAGGGTASGRGQTASPGSGPSASGPASSGSASIGPASSGTAGLVACRPGSLRITVNAGQAGTAAGSTYYPLDFTNVSRSACGMYGYPGISFVSARGMTGHQIGAAAERDPVFGKLPVRLAADGIAHAWLQVAEAGNYPASTCQPVKAHWLRVFAPGQTVPDFVSHTFDACASPKVSLLTVLPVRAGRGIQGKTP
jgi:hypothetical protein